MAHSPKFDLQNPAFLAELITAANPRLSCELSQGNFSAALLALMEHIRLRDETIPPSFARSSSSLPLQSTRARAAYAAPFYPAPFFLAAESDDVFRPANFPLQCTSSGYPSRATSFACPSPIVQYDSDPFEPDAPTYPPHDNNSSIFQIFDRSYQCAQRRSFHGPTSIDPFASPTGHGQYTAASPFTSYHTSTSPSHTHNSTPAPTPRLELATPITHNHNFTSHNTTPNLQSPTSFTFEPPQTPGAKFRATPNKFRKWQANDTAESMSRSISEQGGRLAGGRPCLNSSFVSGGIVDNYGLLSIPMVPRLEASDEDIEAMDLTDEQLAAVREQFGVASEEGVSEGTVSAREQMACID